MEEILITGGAGFVGSHLSERYLKMGYKVTVIDNFKTGFEKNLKGLENSQNLELITSDLTSMKKYELDVLVKRSSLVYHLASTVGVDLVDIDPKLTSVNNIKSTMNLLPLLEKHRKKIIFTSTSEVYGSKESGSFHEDDNLVIGSPKKLRWSYACSKLMQEFMIRSFNVDSIIVRLFNVVGPKQTGEFGMVLPRFVDCAKTNKPFKIYGNGQQVRCFCHINDCVDALVTLSKTESCYNEIFNIGNDIESTILELAERVMQISRGTKAEIEMHPYSEVFTKNHDEIMRRVPNISKLRQFINYSPKYSLDDIIRSMLNG